jgi:hypothetical protein
MNRFPIPVFSPPAAAVAAIVMHRRTEANGTCGTKLPGKSTSAWGPDTAVAGFTQDAAAAEARERVLFFDSFVGAAF